MLDYSAFLNKYDSEIDEDGFKRLSSFILARINYLTFNRIDYEDDNMVELVDNCIADIIYQLGIAYILNDQASNNYLTGGLQGAIKSESVGQHSITYQDVKQKTADELRREKNGLVNTRKNLKSLDNLLKIRLSNIERVHKRLITKIKKLKERVDQTIKLR